MKKIYDESFKDLMDKGTNFLKYVPAFESLKSGLYPCIKKGFKVQKLKYTHLNEVEVPDHLANEFLVINDGSNDKILIFMTVDAIKLLPCVDDFFGDGTFQSCPDPFYQIYSIHGDINSIENCPNIFPLHSTRNDFKISRAIHNIEMKKRKTSQSVKNKKIAAILNELMDKKITVFWNA